VSLPRMPEVCLCHPAREVLAAFNDERITT
jgi:hypothetical protein